MLVVKFFLLPAVSHQVFHDLPVHQRFPAEEIHLQVSPLPGIGDQEVQRLLAHLIGHERPPPVVFAFLSEAVFTGKVTVVGDMQAQRLDHGLSLLYFIDIVLIHIPGEQPSLFGQLCDSLQDVRQILFCIFPAQPLL